MISTDILYLRNSISIHHIILNLIVRFKMNMQYLSIFLNISIHRKSILYYAIGYRYKCVKYLVFVRMDLRADYDKSKLTLITFHYDIISYDKSLC